MKLLTDGLYQLRFRDAVRGMSRLRHDLETGGEALCMLRDGVILGSDRWGGVFTGTYRFDAASGTGNVSVRIDVPPDGELITGFAAGPRGASIDVVAALRRAACKVSATADVAGRKVDVDLDYIGPPPV